MSIHTLCDRLPLTDSQREMLARYPHDENTPALMPFCETVTGRRLMLESFTAHTAGKAERRLTTPAEFGQMVSECMALRPTSDDDFARHARQVDACAQKLARIKQMGGDSWGIVECVITQLERSHRASTALAAEACHV